MRTLARWSVLALIVGIAFEAGAWRRDRAAVSGSGATRTILHYVDPMHPAYTSDRPGIAPDCGMQLEPVYADGAGPDASSAGPRSARTVAVSGERQQLFGVRVAVAERAPGSRSVRLFGRVTADERRVFTLNAAMEGSIREVSAVTTGARVRKGQWLASFFSADARSPLQAYITALDVEQLNPLQRADAGVRISAGAEPSTNTQFTVERLRGFGMSSEQIAEMRRTRKIPITIGIRAPADGFVLARNVSVGQKFERGAEWFRIANLDRVWILADVTEDDARAMRPGALATISIPNRGERLTARVAAVLPQFDPTTRTLKVRLETDNPDYALRPDMFVDVEFAVDLPPAIRVPRDALVDAGQRRVVFVEQGEGLFEPRDVETGSRAGDRVEIVRGLSPGERIVTSGTFLVDSESRLRAAANGVHGASSRDPVCGMEVDEARARAAGRAVEKEGKTYFFCSDQCRSRFTGSSEKPAANAHHGDHDHSL